MNKMNHTIATIETSKDNLNLTISIPKSKLSEKITRDFILDTIKTADDIFYNNAVSYPVEKSNSTITLVTDTYDLEYDIVNETQIRKSDTINNNYLGDHITEEQSANISNGTFNGLPIGAYWTIDNINYRIMAHDHYYGYNGIDKHHVVVMPDTIYSMQKYNNSDTNSGGYNSSALKKYIENKYNTIIRFAFGANHILSHTHDLTSGTYDDGALIHAGNTKAWLITSYNLNGNKYEFETNYNWQDADKMQFPAFENDTSLKIAKYNGSVKFWWLGSSVSHVPGNYCTVNSAGKMTNYGTSYSYGVRPAFLVY